MGKGYWMWYPGDYEIYHVRELNLRRQEFGVDYPTFWHLSSPYVSIIFERSVVCDKTTTMTVALNGKGYINVDNTKYTPDVPINLDAGVHKVSVTVFNTKGLPAAFVECDACPSGEGWMCGCRDGRLYDAGFDTAYDSKEKSPDVFPFEYKRLDPVKKEMLRDGELFDFGGETFGYLNVENKCDCEVLIVYGESREEALDPQNALLFEKISGKGLHRLRQRAFRWIYAIGGEVELTCDYEYLPLEQKGRFECDDELFNRIYETSVKTFWLNCREAFLDGIKRDRWVWSGDAYQSCRINSYLFADKKIEQRTAIGLVGKEPVVSHINTIVDYSLLWVIGLWEHYMTYGDIGFLSRSEHMLTKLMEFCLQRLDENGFIVGRDADWTFIDWADIDKTGAVCAEQMLLAAACDATARVYDLLGLDGGGYSKRSAELKQLINDKYWDKEKGAFIDSFSSGKRNVTRHANIFAVMYGIADGEQTKSILNNVLKNDEVPMITTPYFKGYELDVLAMLGEFGTVEDIIRSYWGGMISLGADTIWEEYDPTMTGTEHYGMYGMAYGKSLCHAWGAGSVYIFGRYYLGVRATAAGYGSFVVEPHLGGLGKIKGRVPVGDGFVDVELDKDRLYVLTDKAGGKVVFDGKEYDLVSGVGLEVRH